MINFEDFQKIDLRVGKVIQAEKVEGSAKLLALQVDLGEEIGKRQIVAGIGQFYSVETLIGKQIAVAVNLAPRTLMGLESQGMLLAANDEDKVVVLVLGEEVKNGAKIK